MRQRPFRISNIGARIAPTLARQFVQAAFLAGLACLLPAAAILFAVETEWRQAQKILALDGTANDRFGYAVSISHDTALIGTFGNAAGAAYVIQYDGDEWTQQEKLSAPSGNAYDYFGYDVSLGGSWALVGAYNDDDKGTGSGAAYMFLRDGSQWDSERKLYASDGVSGDNFGRAVDISGHTAIIGAYKNDDNGSDSGAAYIFRYSGSRWQQEQKLLPDDGGAADYFGYEVSISGETAVVGAYNDDDNGGNAGAVYVFAYDGSDWVQQQKLLADDGVAGDLFGKALSIRGDRLAVGAEGDDEHGADSGSVYVFRFDGENWVQEQKLLADDGAAAEAFGRAVAVLDEHILIGAQEDEDNGNNAGSAYLFKNVWGTWTQQQKLMPDDGDIGDNFGNAVALSSEFAVIAACGDEVNGSSSGSVYLYEAPEPPGQVTLLQPDGGEVLVAGSEYEITWQTTGLVENVLLEYSANQGANWIIIDTVPNSDAYAWRLPAINSDECLVRISNSDFSADGDISSDVFRIYTCALLYDLNSDCILDFSDFCLLASEWLHCGDPNDMNCLPNCLDPNDLSLP